jgi:hypothetical protein
MAGAGTQTAGIIAFQEANPLLHETYLGMELLDRSWRFKYGKTEAAGFGTQTAAICVGGDSTPRAQCSK